MQKLWRYLPESEFTNKNAGFSMWCFGTSEGKEFFIKQFLSPKYPAEDNVSSPEKIERKKRECALFEQRHRDVYQALSRFSDGNDIRIVEFFRVGSRYYIATEKVDALPWTVETIAALEESEKRRLCAIIAHAVAALHRGRLIHSDLKHDNILYTRLASGKVTAKIIDFDGSFLESRPPSMEDGVTGDTNYFSPEVCARAYGEERPLTCKMDVFALGVLFHQYYTGKMPQYEDECTCPGESALRGSTLKLSDELPKDIAALLKRMLSPNPEERPSSQEAFLALRPAKQPAAVPKRPPAPPRVHFCTKCGKQITGTERICAACTAALSRKGAAAEPRSPFYVPGNL